MIKFEHTEVVGWQGAIRGMRNPMNSWDKSDSGKIYWNGTWYTLDPVIRSYFTDYGMNLLIGPNDADLMKRLRNAGTDHRKFMRMITVYVDITAPLYWWKEFDTYKVGTVANSCSTMHKIADKEFTMEDFSCEHLDESSLHLLKEVIDSLNYWRIRYIQFEDDPSILINHGMTKKDVWWQMIQLLPSSYNQRRTVMMNYEVLANIYKSRMNHKLDEWAEHNSLLKKEDDDIPGVTVLNHEKEPYFGFCDWLKTLPYSELITGDVD